MYYKRYAGLPVPGADDLSSWPVKKKGKDTGIPVQAIRGQDISVERNRA